MATIRKITRSAPLSNFQQPAAGAGSLFAALGDVAQQASDLLMPIFEEEASQEFAALGAADGQNVGGLTPAMTGGSGDAALTGNSGGDAPVGRDNFIAAMMPHAQRVGAELGIDPRLIIAQSALETGWGEHAPGNNYFGIKSHGQEGGNVLATSEVYGGQEVRINDSFRAYGSLADSVADYGNFLRENPRYQGVLGAATLSDQIAAMGASGYATDPNYAAKLSDIANGITLGGGGMGTAPGGAAQDTLGPRSQFDTTGVAPEALTSLARLEQMTGQTFNVRSAHRDEAENERAGGARNSQHIHGNAFDIDVRGMSTADRTRLIQQARAAGFGGVGVYANSLHFDVGTTRHWGPDYSSGSLPSWAAQAVNAPRAGGSSQTASETGFDFVPDNLAPPRGPAGGPAPRPAAAQAPATPTLGQDSGNQFGAAGALTGSLAPPPGQNSGNEFGPPGAFWSGILPPAQRQRVVAEITEALTAEGGPPPDDTRLMEVLRDRFPQGVSIQPGQENAVAPQNDAAVLQAAHEALVPPGRPRARPTGEGDVSDQRRMMHEVRMALMDPPPEAPPGRPQARPDRPSPAAPSARPANPAAPPVTVRGADGRLQRRLYSPASVPAMQRANAAYMTAFLGEATMRGQADLMSIAAQMPMQPEAFLEAGRAYVDQMVAQVDPMMQRGLRAELTERVSQRYLGMLGEAQDDIQRRAVNASTATTEMYASEYAQALALGDTEAADAALANLQGALYNRERLPGLSWTPEQSANVIGGAQDDAVRLRDSATTEQASAVREILRTIIDARKDGLTGANEDILDDPMTLQLAPEEAAEATAWIEFRDNFAPGFAALPRAQQREELALMRAAPVQDDYDRTMIATATTAANQSDEAWARDPVAQAQATLAATSMGPPPALPSLDATTPDGYINALTARRRYMDSLAQQGYLSTAPAYLSTDEADMMSPMVGPEAPPELRLAVAGALVAGLGDQAGSALRQIGQDDPTFVLAGQIIAGGGSSQVADTMLRGQAALEAGTAAAPTRIAPPAAIAPALAAMGQADVTEAMQGVRALHAAMVNDTAAPTAEEAARMWNLALGQQTLGALTYGGIQRVGGHQVALPPNLAGARVETALSAAFGNPANVTGVLPYRDRSAGLIAPQAGEPLNQSMWVAATTGDRPGSLPYGEGRPLTSDYFARGQFQLQAIPGGLYRAWVMLGPGATPIPVTDSQGVELRIDVQKLIEAMP